MSGHVNVSIFLHLLLCTASYAVIADFRCDMIKAPLVIVNSTTTGGLQSMDLSSGRVSDDIPITESWDTTEEFRLRNHNFMVIHQLINDTKIVLVFNLSSGISDQYVPKTYADQIITHLSLLAKSEFQNDSSNEFEDRQVSSNGWKNVRHLVILDNMPCLVGIGGPNVLCYGKEGLFKQLDRKNSKHLFAHENVIHDCKKRSSYSYGQCRRYHFNETQVQLGKFIFPKLKKGYKFVVLNDELHVVGIQANNSMLIMYNLLTNHTTQQYGEFESIRGLILPCSVTPVLRRTSITSGTSETWNTFQTILLSVVLIQFTCSHEVFT